MPNDNIKSFGAVAITSGQNKEFGLNGLTTLAYGSVDSFTVLSLDVQSAGAGVATITFDSGNGYSATETVNAGAKADFLIYGVTSFKIAASVANITVVAKLCDLLR